MAENYKDTITLTWFNKALEQNLDLNFKAIIKFTRFSFNIKFWPQI